MRVAGTSEARRAWLTLRGPYLLAYIGLLLYSIVVNTDAVLWQIVVALAAAMLIIGALGSWLVVNDRPHSRIWVFVGVMEVTGLRALSAFEYLYSLWTLFFSDHSLGTSLAHFVIASLLLGILANMAWHKGTHRDG